MRHPLHWFSQRQPLCQRFAPGHLHREPKDTHAQRVLSDELVELTYPLPGTLLYRLASAFMMLTTSENPSPLTGAGVNTGT
jgi:hypothetical protein